MSHSREPARRAEVRRETSETSVSVKLNLDGSGQFQVRTGIKTFDHLLCQVARHGLFDMDISATGWDQHHLVEDVAICLGRALDQALAERRGIGRMGHAIVPMDDALAVVAVDISGRGYAVVDVQLGPQVGELQSDLVRHFCHTLATEGKLNLHAMVLKGANDHHKVEALFKALGRALKHATRPEERLGGDFPSTKGTLG